MVKCDDDISFASERESTTPVYVETHILVIINQIFRDVNERRHLILTLDIPRDVK